jgi:mRNA interferase MazF
MKRGEVRWVEFTAPGGRRPVVILTRNSSINLLNAVTVAPVTTNLRATPAHVYLDEDDGMPRACNVNLHGLQTIPKSTVGKLITALSQTQTEKLEQALDYALGFGEIV